MKQYFMGDRTSLAEGLRLKAGAQRRIAVTMDERLFLALRTMAVEDGRSISAEIVRRLKHSFRANGKRQ